MKPLPLLRSSIPAAVLGAPSATRPTGIAAAMAAPGLGAAATIRRRKRA